MRERKEGGEGEIERDHICIQSNKGWGHLAIMYSAIVYPK